MPSKLEEFIRSFVLPLHAGGVVQVSRPFGMADHATMMADASALMDDELRLVRARRAAELLCDAAIGDPDGQDLALWMAMHNLLVLDHPDTDRVWARDSTWDLVRRTTQNLLYASVPHDQLSQLSRHVGLQRLIDLGRRDEVVRVGEQSLRFRGQAAPRSVRRMASIGEVELSEEKVRWLEAEHSPAVVLLLPDLFAVSPLTALLVPTRAGSGFDPRGPARWLHSRGGARAVVYEWVRSPDWVDTGAAVVGVLLEAMGRGDLIAADRPQHSPKQADLAADEEDELEANAPAALAAATDHGPGEHAALLGALIHLHLLKVLAFEARVGLGGRSRRAAARAFLALPLLLPQCGEVLGDPTVGIEEPDALRRWDDYLSHLRGLVPHDVVSELADALLAPLELERASERGDGLAPSRVSA